MLQSGMDEGEDPRERSWLNPIQRRCINSVRMGTGVREDHQGQVQIEVAVGHSHIMLCPQK